MAEANPYSAPESKVAGPEQYGQVKVLSPGGRLGRLRYLAYGFGFGLIAMIVQVAMGPIAVSSGGSGATAAVMGVVIIVSLGLMVVSFLLAIQRLHDMNTSGWLCLLLLVPIVNAIMALVLLIAPGTRGENRFGAQPPPNGTGVVLVSLVVPLVFVVGIVAAIAIPAYQDYTLRAQAPQVDIQP